MSQTSYPLNIAAAKVGQLADMGPVDIVTKTHATLKVLFGCLISLGANNELGKIPALATDVTANAVGFVVADQSQESLEDSAAPGVPAGKQFGVLQKGRMWAKCEDPANFAVGLQASIRYAGTGDKGVVVCTPVSMETALLPKSRILEVNATLGLALVEINLV